MDPGLGFKLAQSGKLASNLTQSLKHVYSLTEDRISYVTAVTLTAL
jgi:hypothetical protein